MYFIRTILYGYPNLTKDVENLLRFFLRADI